jgi:hypothetical protein
MHLRIQRLNRTPKRVHTVVYAVVSQHETKIQGGTGSRHTIYLRKDLVSDSNFPFEVGESLTIRIEGQKLVIEKAKIR